MTLALTNPLPPARGAVLARPASAVLIVWLLSVVIVGQQMLPALIAHGPADPDVLVRLVQVRDLIAGQSWFDLTQYRLGLPDGVPMHWSRLADLPVAALVLLFGRVLTPGAAEIAAMTVWPALLLLGLVAAVTAIAMRLAGREAAWPAALMTLFAIHLRYLFSPGNIDHHNLQLVLALATLAGALRLDSARAGGVVAGLSLAAMLAIGMETLPLVALVGLAAVIAVVVAPGRFSPGASALGLALALATPALHLATLPSGRAAAFLCDALSPPYLAAAVIGGGGLALLAMRAARMTLPVRLAAAAALGVVTAGAALSLGPRCLLGPYAEIDPELARRWLSSVDEAKSWRALLGDDAGKAVSILGAPLVALAVGVVFLRRAAPQDRFAWALTLACGVLTTAIMLAQIRGAAFAAAFALAPGAALIAAMRARLGGRTDVRAQALLVAAWLAPQAMTFYGLSQAALALGLAPQAAAPVALPGAAPRPAPTAAQPCFDRNAFAPLAALPAARVLAPSNLGPAIIANTPHAALAGPYHRDAAGILASFDAFEGSPETARRIARERGLTLVAACLDDSAFAAAALGRPSSFAAAIANGPLPDFLEPVSIGQAIRIYRIRP
jgi:hypothetical protein